MVISAMEKANQENATDSGTGEGHGDRVAAEPTWAERLLHASEGSTIGTPEHVGFVPATNAQIDYLRRLIRTRGTSQHLQGVILGKIDKGELSKEEARKYIVQLKNRLITPRFH